MELGQVTKLQFSSNERLLASLANNKIHVFDLKGGVHLHTIDISESSCGGSKRVRFSLSFMIYRKTERLLRKSKEDHVMMMMMIDLALPSIQFKILSEFVLGRN